MISRTSTYTVSFSINRLTSASEYSCSGKTKWHTSTINKILTERDVFLKTLQQNIAKAVVNADTLSPDGIQSRLLELQKELIKKANNKQDYDAIANHFSMDFKSGITIEIEDRVGGGD